MDLYEPVDVAPSGAHGLAFTGADGGIGLVDDDGTPTLGPAEPGATWQVSDDRGVAARLREDGRLVVRDLPSGLRLGDLPVPIPASGIARDLSPYNSVRMRFRPGHRELLTVASGAELTRWDLDRTHWRRTACRIAGRDLSAAEWRRATGQDDLPGDLSCVR